VVDKRNVGMPVIVLTWDRTPPGSWQGELGIIIEADAKGIREFIRRLEARKERGD
jgi:hypothetical protein